MVITDRFVYIHKPKTGGTFVTDAILNLYEGKWTIFHHAWLATAKVLRYKNRFGNLWLTADKHGGCNNIPKSQLQKTIVSTIRNPFDYYVSQYEFGWWKRKEWLRYYKTLEGFSTYEKNFPNLSFTQFMELMSLAFNPARHRDFYNPECLGRNTVEFVNDCFHEPEEVLSKLSHEYIGSAYYRADMYPVQFIFTHKLNQQLYEFLLQQGYPEESIHSIIAKKKVLPQGKGRKKEQAWEKYYTPELKVLVRKKDWMLFQLFSEFEDMEKEQVSVL